jgi:hypothetical protein
MDLMSSSNEAMIGGKKVKREFKAIKGRQITVDPHLMSRDPPCPQTEYNIITT